MTFRGILFRGMAPGDNAVVRINPGYQRMSFCSCTLDGRGTRLIPAWQAVSLYYQVFGKRRGAGSRKQNLFWNRIFRWAEYGYKPEEG